MHFSVRLNFKLLENIHIFYCKQTKMAIKVSTKCVVCSFTVDAMWVWNWQKIGREIAASGKEKNVCVIAAALMPPSTFSQLHPITLELKLHWIWNWQTNREDWERDCSGWKSKECLRNCCCTAILHLISIAQNYIGFEITLDLKLHWIWNYVGFEIGKRLGERLQGVEKKRMFA